MPAQPARSANLAAPDQTAAAEIPMSASRDMPDSPPAAAGAVTRNAAAEPNLTAPGAPSNGLAHQVGASARRKLHAAAHPAPGALYGLGMMGLVGWAVAVPTLAGAGLGWWLDTHHAGRHGWTLALLAAGLTLGCFNAWRWIAGEQSTIDKEAHHDEP